MAQALGTWHLAEAVRVQRLADEDTSLEAARRVLRWITRDRLKEISTTLLTQQGPRPRLKANQAGGVLDVLEGCGYLMANKPDGQTEACLQGEPSLFSQFSQFSRGER